MKAKIVCINNIRVISIAFISVLLLTACGGGDKKKEVKPSFTTDSESGCSKLTQKIMLDHINKLRSIGRYCSDADGKQEWYAPSQSVKWNGYLATATNSFANDMANRDYYNYFETDAHLQPDASYKLENAITVKDRIKTSGYADAGRGQKAFGENIGFSNDVTPVKSFNEVVNSWLKSTKGHCNTLMHPKVQDFAMSCAYNETTKKYYFVQLFGMPVSL